MQASTELLALIYEAKGAHTCSTGFLPSSSEKEMPASSLPLLTTVIEDAADV